MRITILILIAFFSLCPYIYAQDIGSKGISINRKPPDKETGKTYALIIGISKYRNPGIPQLQFADRDATAFRDYLLATGVDSNNIITLLNEKATNGEFWADLNFITDLAKSGDKVYIYFSGHGDVENKTVVKDAYLLPYDAPQCVYPAGAIAVPLLKSWIATLSSNGIQAIFIADACHSGNLAGGREGMEATATMLKDKWQDEIKILSCQPGELSLEGKQWGDGRGLFSYELINGMAGMADKNKDGKVTLRELNLYLLDKVPDEASPMLQNPMLMGNMETEVSKTNPILLEKIVSHQGLPSLASIDVKGFEETLLKGLDDSLVKNYKLFKLCLENGCIAKGVNCKINASSIYSNFPFSSENFLLEYLMKKNLVAACIVYIEKDIGYYINSESEKMGDNNPRYACAKTLREILGDDKLTSLQILPEILFANAIYKASYLDSVHLLDAVNIIDSAISISPNSAYLHNLKGDLFSDLPDSILGAFEEYKFSLKFSPNFVLPYVGLTSIYINKLDFDSASIICSFLRLKTPFYYYLYSLQIKYLTTHSQDSLLPLIDTLNKIINNSESENCKEQESYRYANILHEIKQYDLSIKYSEEILKQNPFPYNLYLNIAECYSQISKKNDALKALEKFIIKLIKNKIDDLTLINQSKDLANIRSTPEFKALMRKYFPDQYKE